jgi:hypothetical protein
VYNWCSGGVWCGLPAVQLAGVGSLTDRRGYLWRKSDNDLYLVETLPLMFTANVEESCPANQVISVLFPC